MKSREQGSTIPVAKLAMVRRREQVYARNMRIAVILVLVALLLGFVFVKMPEARPLAAKTDYEPVVIDFDWEKAQQYPTLPKRTSRPAVPVAGPGGVLVPAGKNDPEPVRVPDPAVIDAPDLPVYRWHTVQKLPVLVHETEPEYHEFLVRSGLEGTVVVAAILDTLGRVCSTEVHTSSGNRLMDSSALKCVGQWRFTPAYQRDRPVRVKFEVVVKFRLH